MSLSCAHTPADPSRDVLVDAVVSPGIASIGDQVSITIRAYNPGPRAAEWSAGCGQDLGFEIVSQEGRVAQHSQSGGCTLEHRRLRLEAGASMERRTTRRLGDSVPASQFPDGRYKVRGLLGLDAQGRRSGTTAVLEIKR